MIVLGAVYICDSNCFTCRNILNPTSNSFSYCLNCYDGQGLKGSICVNCEDPNARTCSTNNASFSFTCATGYTAVSGTCTACGSSCLKCNNNGAGQCDSGSCISGFFQARGSTTCVSCFAGCTTCDRTNPNNCLDCGSNRFSNNGKCEACSSNCISCSSATKCTSCVGGYVVANDGSCKLPPGPPCVAYDGSLTCTQCSGSFVLTNGNCVFSSDCNATATCPTCSYNYYLSSGRCLLCPQLFKCQSCNLLNSSQCLVCTNGYHVTSTYTCEQCMTGCATCTSALFCTLAADGYYLRLNYFNANTGRVSKCDETCTTCSIQATSCLSCPSSATLSGDRCINKYNYKSRLVGRDSTFNG